jgi:anti-anti-sigma factor
LLKTKVTLKEEGTYVVRPVGQIDSVTYEQFEKDVTPVINSAAKAIILDMAGVDYITSRGLAVIFKIRKNVEAVSGSFIMLNLQPQVQTVFDIINALPDMNVFESMEEADNYLSAIQRKEREKERGDG